MNAVINLICNKIISVIEIVSDDKWWGLHIWYVSFIHENVTSLFLWLWHLTKLISVLKLHEISFYRCHRKKKNRKKMYWVEFAAFEFFVRWKKNLLFASGFRLNIFAPLWMRFYETTIGSRRFYNWDQNCKIKNRCLCVCGKLIVSMKNARFPAIVSMNCVEFEINASVFDICIIILYARIVFYCFLFSVVISVKQRQRRRTILRVCVCVCVLAVYGVSNIHNLHFGMDRGLYEEYMRE